MSVLATLPAGIDDQGWLFIPTDLDVAHGWHRYEGMRVRTYRDPDDPARVIVQQLGGLEDEFGFETDGFAASLSPVELRVVAARLIAAADAVEPRDPVDAAGP